MGTFKIFIHSNRTILFEYELSQSLDLMGIVVNISLSSLPLFHARPPPEFGDKEARVYEKKNGKKMCSAKQDKSGAFR